MSEPVKGPGPESSGQGKGEMPFEQALQKLEAIVESMEADELPLESLLTRFEEGTKLAQICQAKLAEAELKIQQLEKSADGGLVLKPITVLNDNSREA